MNSARQIQLLTAVIEWIDHWHTPAEREELIRWFTSSNTQSGTPYQLNIKSQLQSLLPVIFNSNGDQTFVDGHNRTLLHLCILSMQDSNNTIEEDKQHDKILVRNLCKLGASIIADDYDGETPLGIALHKQRIDLVSLMLHSNINNLTECNRLDQTILHILLDKYNYNQEDYFIYDKLVEDLIGRGANLNKPDKNGVTPVHLAANFLDIRLLEFCEVKGADLYSKTNAGDDIFIIICKNIAKLDDKSVATQIIYWLVNQGFNWNSKNNNYFTPLHYMPQFNNQTLIQNLVRAGVDIHAVATDNTNLLHSAAMSSSLIVFEYLAECGIDLYRRDNCYGFSLIHMAALNYDEYVLEWLLKKGFDANDLSKSCLTPLHLASTIGNAKIVEKLIEYGANVNCVDINYNYTPLNLATMRGNFVSIKETTASKLDANKIDDNSSLVHHCFNCLRSNVNQDYQATFLALLKAGADVNLRDNHGRRPLHYATLQSKKIYFENLLEAGAYVDTQDIDGYTPLHNSFISDKGRALKCLLTFGANINDIEHPSKDVFGTNKMLENSTKCFVMEQLVKLKVAGLPMEDVFRSYIANFEFKNYEQSCLHELANMKEWMIAPAVSLYNFLHMDYKKRAELAGSLPIDLKLLFPRYYYAIKSRCSEAIYQMTCKTSCDSFSIA